VKLIFKYETVHCSDGALVASLDFHLSHATYSAIVHLNEPGYPGITAFSGGILYLESCILDRCGGGGVFSVGKGSLIEMNDCTVRHMRQMGIEACNWGIINNDTFRPTFGIHSKFH
jgi:hypothetical protein